MTSLRNFPYFFKEALKSLCRNGWMSLASVAVVAVTLFLLGAFLLVNYNVNLFTEDIKDQVEIVVYLDDISTTEREDLRIRIIGLEEIQEVKFVSKREALERLKVSMGDRASYLEDYEDDANNPLDNSFEVKTVVPEDVSVAAQNIRKFAGVNRVDYGEGFVERLFELTRGVKLAVLIFMLSLGITAVFLIGNTIKLTVFSRSDEIKIMKYVGATDWFIRWPFLFEGLLLGFWGAFLPFLCLNYGYCFLVDAFQARVAFLAFVPPQLITSGLLQALLPLGVFIGGLGSMLSTQRFLKV